MQTITCNQLREKLASQEDFMLIDVREDYEHRNFNIGGMLIPLGEIIKHADKIPKDKTVIFYCRKGVRSQIAIQKLEARFGFTNLINLEGGIEKWK
ncbi:MAG TPA: rhodanese-like domain-containing protein [Segetibacter sp.]|jgi:adenylyltransferase/sulfurtransferase